MPFSSSARITITNEGRENIAAFYYYIDYAKMDKLEGNIGRFHAKYRQESPCKIGKDYLILEAQGNGVFMGCNLSIHLMEYDWWGEGDDKIYIDGSKDPVLIGTGAEDYFCGAWGYDSNKQTFSYPYYGCPLNGGFENLSKWNVYRYHIEDPIPFKKSISVYIEHGHSRYESHSSKGANDRSDVYSSVAYWYQTEPHVEFSKLLPAKKRIESIKATAGYIKE